MLFDLAEPEPEQQTTQSYRDDLRDENWKSEAAVLKALRALGHEVELFGLHSNVAALLAVVDRFKPGLIFNLCEAFAGRRDLESQVAALLELPGSAKTGASATALTLCKDKALAKTLVAAAGIDVPRSIVVPRGASTRTRTPTQNGGWTVFPALVKPLELESSQGISNESFVRDERQLATRVRFVHESLNQNALVEEYIDGRELYLSFLSTAGGLEVYPARELHFGARRAGEPRIATYRTKWDDDYRRRRGIRGGPARAAAAELAPALNEVARRAARALKLDRPGSYARLDLRVAPDKRIVFLEANPNPSIAADDDFAASASYAGLRYAELIARVLASAASETPARLRRGRETRRSEAGADCLQPDL